MRFQPNRWPLLAALPLAMTALALATFRAPGPAAAAAPDDFYMLLCSDTQYPWNELSDGKKTQVGDVEATGQKTRQDHIRTMNQLIAKLGGPAKVRGLIINGDLTAFGHDWQLDKYRQMYAAVTTRLYPGLGNHDYANNVNDTVENQAARRMVDYLHDTVTGLRPRATAKELASEGIAALAPQDGEVRSFDYTVGKTYYKFPANRRDHEGSLAYSWEIGSIHFVQLNNYPTYATAFDGWNFGDARRDYYTIKSALSWLKKDLADARRRGKRIFVNYHDPGEHWTPESVGWNQILADYDVSAQFVGHLHERSGLVGGATVKGGRVVPTFYCGSALYHKYLLLHVTGDEFKVQTVDSANGKLTLEAEQVKPLY